MVRRLGWVVRGFWFNCLIIHKAIFIQFNVDGITNRHIVIFEVHAFRWLKNNSLILDNYSFNCLKEDGYKIVASFNQKRKNIIFFLLIRVLLFLIVFHTTWRLFNVGYQTQFIFNKHNPHVLILDRLTTTHGVHLVIFSIHISY